jgi:hypothetical protein
MRVLLQVRCHLYCKFWEAQLFSPSFKALTYASDLKKKSKNKVKNGTQKYGFIILIHHIKPTMLLII